MQIGKMHQSGHAARTNCLALGSPPKPSAMDRTQANTGTRDVAERLRFDEAALLDWMQGHVTAFRGPLAVSQFKGGQSNPTYRLDAPSGSYVLRRKPPGKLLPGAHAVEREYRVISALGAAGFPVPRVHGLCEAETIIGTPFYVMDLVEGRIVWEAHFPGMSNDDRAAHFDAMNGTIARLHSFDPQELGLADYGRAAGFVERQVARWSKQYLGDTEAGRMPAMDRLVDWLEKHLPPDSGDARIAHGDFRCDNMIFAANEPEVIAVLDWELSTIGDPAADFTYHLLMYRMPADLFSGLAGMDLRALGIPSEADYVAAYCRRTGRDSLPNLDYLVVFCLFRLAAIIHGIKGRLVRGSASSAHAAQMVERLEPLAELALAQAQNARL
jgi:aminoglycoside phosphotransferase (APT) family kinase protein